LGWGSNTLVASAGVAGHTLLLRKVDDWLPLAKGPEGEHRFFGGAGVHLAKIAKATVDAELEGGEFLIGIPGTLGGAVCMNAGAMGQETSGMIETVWVWDRPSGQVQQLTPAELAFAYRYSAINPQRQVVLGAVCHFSPSANPAALRQRMEANRQFRKEHHPIEPNGGSVFRNPEGVGLNGEALPAVGRMVEALGAKGLWQEGEAGISERHGNFIVNRGQATSTQVLKLMRRVQQAIESAYGGLRVYPENRWMGEATPEELALWQALTAGDPHRHPTA
jgi:UDP-N-acetylmuramate dehydrogenase